MGQLLTEAFPPEQKVDILGIDGIFRVSNIEGLQYYSIMATNRQGDKYVMSLVCSDVDKEECETAFSKFRFIPAPTQEEFNAIIAAQNSIGRKKGGN